MQTPQVFSLVAYDHEHNGKQILTEMSWNIWKIEIFADGRWQVIQSLAKTRIVRGARWLFWGEDVRPDLTIPVIQKHGVGIANIVAEFSSDVENYTQHVPWVFVGHAIAQDLDILRLSASGLTSHRAGQKTERKSSLRRKAFLSDLAAHMVCTQEVGMRHMGLTQLPGLRVLARYLFPDTSCPGAEKAYHFSRFDAGITARCYLRMLQLGWVAIPKPRAAAAGSSTEKKLDALLDMYDADLFAQSFPVKQLVVRRTPDVVVTLSMPAEQKQKTKTVVPPKGKIALAKAKKPEVAPKMTPLTPPSSRSWADMAEDVDDVWLM